MRGPPPSEYSATMTTVAILGTRYPDLAIEEEVLAGVAIGVSDGATLEDIKAVAGDAEVIMVGNTPAITAEVISVLSNCRAIIRSGIGVDSVDLDAARAAGMWVVNVPDYGTEAVSQHTIAMALAVNRRLGQADRIVKSGDWGFLDLRPLHLPNAGVAGVVGLGRIGRRVAELLSAVGFGRVVGHDPHTGAPGVESLSLDDLLSVSDLVCLHAPGPSDGKPLLGAPELASMKSSSVIVNTSRGSLIDSSALVDALSTGSIRAAALDVFSPEPPSMEIYRRVEDRLLLSPHMAWYTEESQSDLRRRSAEEATRILAGESPINVVVDPTDGSA